MPMNYLSTTFRKVLVPLVPGVDSDKSLLLAQAVVEEGEIILAGIVPVPPTQSLSTAAFQAQELRKALYNLTRRGISHFSVPIRATYEPWHDLAQIIHQVEPDLLILTWPDQVEALQINSQHLAHPPCDFAILAGDFHLPPRHILSPVRGGPYAALALRLSLAIGHSQNSAITSLHIHPRHADPARDAPYRGIFQVLRHLPEVNALETTSDNPEEAILTALPNHDLVVMGSPARVDLPANAIGRIGNAVLETSKAGVIVVRTQEPVPEDLASPSASKEAITVLVDRWFAENTYHSDEFSDIEDLVTLKQNQGVSIALALPALNEEATVGNIIQTVKRALVENAPLLDEIVLIDSNSTDCTRQIAADLGVPVYIHQQILPQYQPRRGKGEALWKSLYVTQSDILLWIDTDIVNIHPRFVYGLVGPLLLRPEIQFVKGFYKRPLRVGDTIQAGGGGRVTELTARPLLNLFYPELSGVVQPLSGEYGGRRTALERLPFASGYGVEIGLLIDCLETYGLQTIAQVDLRDRVHHNQPLEALSKMSFAIIQEVIRKLEHRHRLTILEDVNRTMKLIRYETGHFYLDVEEIAEQERPPMIDIPEYAQMLLCR